MWQPVCFKWTCLTTRLNGPPQPYSQNRSCISALTGLLFSSETSPFICPCSWIFHQTPPPPPQHCFWLTFRVIWKEGFHYITNLVVGFSSTVLLLQLSLLGEMTCIFYGKNSRVKLKAHKQQDLLCMAAGHCPVSNTILMLMYVRGVGGGGGYDVWYWGRRRFRYQLI